MDKPATDTASTMTVHHVLVVDDTATNRQILSVFLKKLGHTVDLAENGEQAVSKFATHAYDIVIMDVMMPVMDGYEATRRIKAMCGDRWVPVVFLSALDKDESLVTGLEAGGDDYLPKPVNFVILEAKLRSLSRALALRREVEDARRFNQAITDNLLDAVIIINETGLIEFANPAATHTFGYPQSEMIGRNISMLMGEPHRTRHDGYISNYIGGSAPRIIGTVGREVEGLHKDGRFFPLSLSVSEFRDNGRRMFVGALRDISERKEAEQKLRENARVLQIYHDEREAENVLASEILDQLMRRPGLSDPRLRYWMNPASHFSGDIAAAALADDGRFYVLLADATGHGLAAAISVLPVLTLFYDSIESGLSLDRILAKINGQLRISLPIGRFVACTCLSIDPSSGHCEIWMGGMPSALLIDGTGKLVREIPSIHLPLGIDAFDWERSAASTLAVPGAGCQLVFFSDGLIEARNPAGEEFGRQRLMAALGNTAAAGRLDAVKDAMAGHLGEIEPHDDVTLMIVDLPGPVAA